MHALALVILLAAGSTGAQTMYRCGNTFSQQPCGAGAQAIPIPGATPQVPVAPADPARTEAMKAECREWISRVPQWKDRDSLKMGDIVRGKLQTKTINGSTQRVWMYGTMVNSKNSMGGYVGEKPAICWVNEAETKVLDLYVAGWSAPG